MPDNDKPDWNETLADLKGRFEKLQIHYDLFFRKQMKIEPMKEREEFKRALLRVNPARMTSTKHKFLYQQISHSFHTYCDLWDRKLKALLNS